MLRSSRVSGRQLFTLDSTLHDMYAGKVNSPKFKRSPLSYQGEIPSFIPENAYSAAFGLQWNTWVNTQLDSHTGLPITADRTERMFGPLYSTLLGKQVLEAGCGAGRFTQILLKQGAFVTAFDISSAVYSNQVNNVDNARLRLFRGSITDIPIEDNSFDIVFCPGVVQHTPNPKDTIHSLWAQVKPGGYLIFDQYRHNFSTWMRTAWLVRLLLRTFKPDQNLRITNLLVKWWYPIHRAVAPYRLLEKILFRVSPITAHFNGYPLLSESDRYAWAQLATHDNLTDYYKHQTTLKRLQGLTNSLDTSGEYFLVKAYTIEVRLQKANVNEKARKKSEVIFLKSSDHPSG